MTQSGGKFQFGAFEMDLVAGELRRAGARVRISRGLLAVLGLLVSQPGAVIRREVFQELLWKGEVTAETSLNMVMNRLRRILHDVAARPLLIETVPRRGYRFIAPVQRIPDRSVCSSTRDPAAPESFLLGRYLTWSTLAEPELLAAVGCFEEAIAAEPNFAQAHAGLAQALQLLGAAGTGTQPSADLLPRAKAAARMAIELDRHLADGYAALGVIQMEFEGDLATAAGNLARAVKLNPVHVEAHIWLSQFHVLINRNAEALELATRALQFDPVSPFAAVNLVFLMLGAGRCAEALTYANKMRRLHPHYWFGQSLCGSALLANGFRLEALLRLERGVELAPESLAARSRLGSACTLCGQVDRARQVLAYLEDCAQQASVPALFLARVHGALGDSRRCASLLELARLQNDPELAWLSFDPSFHGLREQVEGLGAQ